MPGWRANAIELEKENPKIKLESKNQKCEVLPGLEPGSKDSESLVMTNYTTGPLGQGWGLDPLCPKTQHAQKEIWWPDTVTRWPRTSCQTTSTGFEPMRAEPSRFRVYRLNHSAKTPRSIAASASGPPQESRLGRKGKKLPTSTGFEPMRENSQVISNHSP